MRRTEAVGDGSLPVRRSWWRRRTRSAPFAALVALAAGCAINPATGERELSLISEADEIAIGRDADPGIVEQFGLYPDDEVQRYVSALGQSLAANSERPDLPWTFRVLDDPLVNAFALPGGYIYVTRGIMTHLGSEAELVGVLGHEIGHVTARHGASQMSRAMLAQLGLGVGLEIAPKVTQTVGGLAQQGLGLLFLKYGRDDERQADTLGLRYVLRSGYDPQAMVEMFTVLERVSSASGGGELPTWLSTHPPPENRSARLEKQIAAARPLADDLKVEREAYLDRLDGMVFGADPRQGYFHADTFFHPELRFRVDVPPGWSRSNTRQAVSLLSDQQDAIIRLTLAGAESAREAATSFFDASEVAEVEEWRSPSSELPSTGAVFEVRDEEGTARLEGLVLFVEQGGNVYRLLAYTKAGDLSRFAAPFRHTLGSFRSLSDRRFLDVRPMRVEIVRLRTATTLAGLHATVDAQTLALVNNVPEDTRFPAGTVVKTIIGGLRESGLE